MLNPETIGTLVGGVWMPKTETHLVDMMIRNPKHNRVVDGKATYQYHKLEAALRNVKRRRIALDIGGHVGLWSMWLAREFEHVHAFEPVPEHAALFELNVDMAKATLHRVALGEQAGTVDIEIPAETTGNAHVAIGGKRHSGTRHVDNPDLQSVTRGVPMVKLDDYLFERWYDFGGSGTPPKCIDFIKIDVEGFERAVVAGAEQTIRRDRPVIVVEQKGNEDNYGESKDAAATLLQSWGMKPIKVMAGDWILGW